MRRNSTWPSKPRFFTIFHNPKPIIQAVLTCNTEQRHHAVKQIWSQSPAALGSYPPPVFKHSQAPEETTKIALRVRGIFDGTYPDRHLFHNTWRHRILRVTGPAAIMQRRRVFLPMRSGNRAMDGSELAVENCLGKLQMELGIERGGSGKTIEVSNRDRRTRWIIRKACLWELSFLNE